MVHKRLREALRITRNALASSESPESATRDLLLFCHGFCAALTGHHESEDRSLFPALAAAHPELRETLRLLEQDHLKIAHLIAGLQSAVERAASTVELDRHLDGIAAIMESHFRYEERQLLTALDSFPFDADPHDALGSL